MYGVRTLQMIPTTLLGVVGVRKIHTLLNGYLGIAHTRDYGPAQPS